MSKDSEIGLEQCYKTLGERAKPHAGSAWDCKIHIPTGLTYEELRIKVGECIVKSKWSVRKAAEHFHVSIGFASRWSLIYRARNTINEIKDYNAIRRIDAFTSITNRPKNVKSIVKDEIRETVIKLRTKYPFFGSMKIKIMGNLDVSPSTIDAVIREEGLANPYVGRHTKKHYGSFEKMDPFDMVQIDFKTWDNGFHSIFVLDDSSRCILSHVISENHTSDVVIEALEEMHKVWNVYPKVILSDHGTEFYSVRGGKGRSVLDKWCKEHGIEHVMGRVRHPQTQGKIERAHLSGEREIRYFGKFDNIDDARETMRKWVEFYNMERPHQSLDYQCPFDVFINKLYGCNLDNFIEAS